MRTLSVILLAVFLLSGNMATAGTPKKKATTKQETLFKRLGGLTAIKAVVDQFVENCAADPRVSAFFTPTASDKDRLAKFKRHLVDQICETSGGNCKYKGKDMRTAHSGMGIKEADFNAVVEDLTAALDKFKVGEMEKNELLGVLGSMKADIVQVRG